ncbi:MAG: SDR family oxidoreductase [Planctomycetes bacterium]|nr:SDR family oxidoreductase [Planctomycetota bacterium]
MNERFFVTGALGCIGAWVVKHLVERGDQAVVYDLGDDARRLCDIVAEPLLAQVQFVRGDITDLAATRRAVAAAAPRAVVHLAGLQVPACRQDPVQGARVNVLGTMHLFDAALAAKVPRLVYASSAAVFGPSEDDGVAVDEHTPAEPVTHYGVFKRANEGTARIYWQEQNLASVGLRPLTVYGVGRDQGMTSGPTTAMKAAVLGRPFRIGFSGPTDFHFVGDTAAAFVAAADGGPPGAHVYNLHGDTLDVADFVRAIEAECPAAKGSLTIQGPRIPIPPELDGSAFRAAYPAVPHTPLAVGVRRTLAAFRDLAAAGRLDTRDLPST